MKTICKGHKVKVVGPGYTGGTGIVHDVTRSPLVSNSYRVVIIGDWDGQLHNFLSSDLEIVNPRRQTNSNQKIEFKVGDEIRCIKDPGDGFVVGSIYSIYASYDGDICVKADSTRSTGYILVGGANNPFGSGPTRWASYFEIVETKSGGIDFLNVTLMTECTHDWKVYRGFMHDDEFCIKCKMTRKLST